MAFQEECRLEGGRMPFGGWQNAIWRVQLLEMHFVRWRSSEFRLEGAVSIVLLVEVVLRVTSCRTASLKKWFRKMRIYSMKWVFTGWWILKWIVVEPCFGRKCVFCWECGSENKDLVLTTSQNQKRFSPKVHIDLGVRLQYTICHSDFCRPIIAHYWSSIYLGQLICDTRRANVGQKNCDTKNGTHPPNGISRSFTLQMAFYHPPNSILFEIPFGGSQFHLEGVTPLGP